ncbi:hypothetical protein [Planctomyces sp. SH-PL14]|uniref:hypothetical protein n=1 Tax=Planctomyces sp. SH-PL14 TaxID=1632864 RepID=UPI00078BCAE7|nr:hypothetical protein [Planctomyces sp. SH-PL14]AMV16961.1 hypothetical protein VT03_03665 [Planctomyces sp. SH-PL14]
MTKWLKHPAIATAFRQEWDKWRGNNAEVTTSWWQTLVNNTVYKLSRDFDPNCKWQANNKKAPDVHRFEENERCFNIELWDQLAKDHRAADLAASKENEEPEPTPAKAEQIPDEWKRLSFLATWFTRAIIKKLDNARSRPKLLALVPAMMAGSGVGALGGLSFALFRYYQDQDLREEPIFSKVLEQTQHKSRANEAALAIWLIEFLRSAELWNAHEAARVAATLESTSPPSGTRRRASTT